ncbi:MAG: hypothetical protein ABFR75_13750 [Acidobacteriota bacterium]
MKSIRVWSNRELKKFSSLFDGEVINVSGWQDKDKEGGKYRDYFCSSKNYYISNYSDDKVRGESESTNTDFVIDLEEKIDPVFIDRFDVVFHHTILEHVSDPVFVFRNLSLMTKDIFISVVPFKQKLHFEKGSYGDYFRFSPMAMRKLYEDNGFTILYESFSPPPLIDIYLFYIGYRKKKWEENRKKTLIDIEKLNGRMGANNYKILLYTIIYNIYIKLLHFLRVRKKEIE